MLMLPWITILRHPKNVAPNPYQLQPEYEILFHAEMNKFRKGLKLNICICMNICICIIVNIFKLQS